MESIVTGAGLKQLPDDRIVCTNAGILRYRPANRYWVEYNYKRVRRTLRLQYLLVSNAVMSA